MFRIYRAYLIFNLDLRSWFKSETSNKFKADIWSTIVVIFDEYIFSFCGIVSGCGTFMASSATALCRILSIVEKFLFILPMHLSLAAMYDWQHRILRVLLQLRMSNIIPNVCWLMLKYLCLYFKTLNCSYDIHSNVGSWSTVLSFWKYNI